jgi:hypothetical protein
VQIARVDDLVEAVGDETCCCHAEKPAAQPSRLRSEDVERRRRGADLTEEEPEMLSVGIFAPKVTRANRA